MISYQTNNQEEQKNALKILEAIGSNRSKEAIEALLSEKAPQQLLLIISDVLREISLGHEIVLLNSSETLTTQKAADILKVSRPFFINKILGNGLIPCTKNGNRRIIKSSDLIAYQKSRKEKGKKLISKITDESCHLLEE